MGKQTSKTYALFQGREKVYIGEAVNTERRAEQHRDEGKRFDRVEITSRPMLKANAQRPRTSMIRMIRSKVRIAFSAVLIS